MAQINLKSLIVRKKETASLIHTLLDTLGDGVAISDPDGNLLAGRENENAAARHPVVLEGETLGWVSGSEHAAVLATLLSHLAAKAAERKTLGSEVLSLYREINLIYNFSEKLSAAFDRTAVAQMALDEANHVITASGGVVLLFDHQTNSIEQVATFGQALRVTAGKEPGNIIANGIKLASNAAIVNDVPAATDKTDEKSSIRSLICAPLPGKQHSSGIILLVNRQPVSYVAAELKLLITIASQAALAIENVLLNEKMVREATREIEERRRELEIAVQERTAELEKQKDNVELLSEIGKEITSSLSVKSVIDTVYGHVNHLMDAAVFGVGIYNEEHDRIDFPASKEKGKSLSPFSNKMNDENRPAVWCFKNRQEVVSNDYEKDWHKWVKEWKTAVAGGDTKSIMYLPLTNNDRAIGVITAQSFEKNAYTEYHLNLLRTIATYAAIALDNADAYRQLNATLENLKMTQQQLVTQEKLASLGALTAGIAHEIKNPLNFVNNFAELSVELIKEIREGFDQEKESMSVQTAEDIEFALKDLEQNALRINEHGKRADSIVRSMQQHSRGQGGERQPTDLNAMLDENLNLAYHGMRARDASFNVTIEKNFDAALGKIPVVPQDMSRVFLNIITNGLYETHERKTQNSDSFTPILSVTTRRAGDRVEVRIRDNGNGIPKDIHDKLFNPFFTTKPAGKGTGLGLSISYDIVVQQHHGEITFKTRAGEFTEFVVSLPNNTS